MTHIAEGILRSWLDAELPAAEQASVATHLAACPECRTALAALETRQAQLTALLSSDAAAPSLALARAHLQARLSLQPAVPVVQETLTMKPQSRFSFPRLPMLAGVVVALMVAALFLPPVRAWAGEFLGLFRVQRIQVVTVDPGIFGEVEPEGLPQMDAFLGESVEVVSSQEGVAVADRAAASAAVGFPVRLPSNQETAREFRTTGGGETRITLRVEYLRAIVEGLNRTDIKIPDSLDGQVVTVVVPNGVSTTYGECRGPGPNFDESDSEARDSGCLNLIQIPSPTITTPPDLDMNAMGQLYLQVLGMDEAESQDFARNVDWATTLIIPMPSGEVESENVSVDGVDGTLIRPQNRSDEFALLWVRDGIVYALMGTGTGADALATANALN